MADAILIDGDQAMFVPAFGAAIVVVQPGKLVASGPGTIDGKKICIDGDEASVEVAGVTYMTPVYSIPGVGVLKIKALAGDQLAQKSFTGGKPMMLKGGQFDAVFEVKSAAKQPPPGPGAPIDDSTAEYSGKGSFIASNTKFTAV
jgi:hypothetical protein